ncbi:MAG: NAD(P)/FAD-dependent oxidoreductase [Alphaproteobacteria bacterium]|nr:NAD(P)/FAD-dependent oxidoreductase [Alphaproteobacteria bacterium]
MVDIVIIGAGPAGMAAAIQADECGASVMLLDEQQEQGGQIYRNVLNADTARLAVMGDDYAAGQSLASALDRPGVLRELSATVWRVDPDGTVTYSVKGVARQVIGRQIIVATGALERPVPLPGWTLPDVLTAGAAQILMKSNGLVADNAVLVGCGPLLYLLAAQMCLAGAAPKALVETQTRGDTWRSLKYGMGALRGWRTLSKGLGLIAAVRRAGVPRYKAATDVRITGTDSAEAVMFSCGGTAREIACDNVFLHQGVVPNTQISRSLGLEHRWNHRQRCFEPVVDVMGATRLERIHIAGDGAAINGAKAAELQGRVTACDVLVKLGRIDPARRHNLVRPLMRALAGQMAVRPFLDALYPPSAEILRPADDTPVCRCEEVTAGDIRNYARIGCVGPNQTKAFGRSGMGPCQGRYCGLTVTEILAKENDMSLQKIGSYRVRAPLKPVTLGELASLAETNGTPTVEEDHSHD